MRQSAKRSRVPTVLDPEELKEFLASLADPAKTAVLLGALTGLRVGELLGLKWSDIDFEQLEIRVIRDVVKQRIERCKTEASKKAIPIDAELAEALWSWRLHCAYNQQDDWMFASPHGKGKQPYWPSSLYRVYLKPALEAIGITEPVGWHTLRHSFGTLAAAPMNERLRYSDDLAKRARDDRAHVANQLEIWEAFWEGQLFAAAGAPAGEAGEAVATESARALRAVASAREALLANVLPRPALDLMLLSFPRLTLAAREQDDIADNA